MRSLVFGIVAFGLLTSVSAFAGEQLRVCGQVEIKTTSAGPTAALVDSNGEAYELYPADQFSLDFIYESNGQKVCVKGEQFSVTTTPGGTQIVTLIDVVALPEVQIDL